MKEHKLSRAYSSSSRVPRLTKFSGETHLKSHRHAKVSEVIYKLILVATAAFTFMLHCRDVAYGWGDKGHRIVAILADTHLTMQAREEVERLLPAGTTLADAAVWPDREGRQITEFDRLHHVNIPDNVAGYSQERDCEARNCMVEALDWFTPVIVNIKAPVNLRLIALRYVAHLLADIHQPLHAGRREDRGGIDITVSYRAQTTNVHLFWDINLVEMEEGDADELAKQLDARITEKQRTKWQSGDTKKWTDESFLISRSNAYTVGESMELSDEYVATTRRIVRRRLAQAGVRLAWLLNKTFK